MGAASCRPARPCANTIPIAAITNTTARNLVTRVDASASKDRVGGEQKRFVHFVGEHMVLTQKPRLWQGVMQHRELHWERIADAPAN